MSETPRPLSDRVALVTGASRGAGRGIALALGDAGATVYVTGRSTRAKSTAPDIGGTVEDVADAVTSRGGRGIPVPCDHTDDEATANTFERIRRDGGVLDLLVNAVWGGNEIPIDDQVFWQQPMGRWSGMFEAGVRAYIACSQHAARMMVERGSGLICHVSFWDRDRYTANLFYDAAKVTMNRLAFGMSIELAPHGVSAVAVSPGFMRTERVMAVYDGDLSVTESPEYVGRAIAALAADPNASAKSGTVVTAGALAREYNFTDIDGTQPPPFELPD